MPVSLAIFTTESSIVPSVVIPVCLLLVHRHPEPVDDCPCFEDAIAFMAVVMGTFLTRWYFAVNGYDERFFVHRMPGKLSGTWPEMWAWWSTATAKMFIGTSYISIVSAESPHTIQASLQSSYGVSLLNSSCIVSCRRRSVSWVGS